ncbi:DUF427 domain-containing protein [Streptomyces sp. NPDC056194]|uniref:DUF427 domain-containing protein n=1 Tax=unclassified Streptomyces TaxID=2593676 RepID=UPI0035DFD750
MSQVHGRQKPAESVWDYPRPPRMVPDVRHVIVRHVGIVLADSRRCIRVLETSHPPVFYVPRQDIRMDLLTQSTRLTHCEWKGVASYWTLKVLGGTVRDVAWSYEEPDAAYAALADHVAFYPGRVDSCTVDGERVLPQPGGFYGGWITDEIVGPFKGVPGSEGW